MNYPDNINLKSIFPRMWNEHIDLELLNKTNNELVKARSQTQNEFYPYNLNDIFKVFDLCDPQNIKVVILGQDPYYSNRDQANGIAFSVNQGIRNPPSLSNILKELKMEYESEYNAIQEHGGLHNWVRQGVFLLNATLTVECGKPNSHQKIWDQFISHVIDVINNKCNNVVFVAWGKSALKKYDTIDTNKHMILETSHPSPLSCYKTDKPFIGSNIFRKINQLLESYNKTIINW